MSVTSRVPGSGNAPLVQNSSPTEIPQPPVKTQKTGTDDAISSTTTSNDGCLAQLWNAICNFFKCICPCLFGHKAKEDASQQTTQTTQTESGSIQPVPTTGTDNLTTEPPSVEQPGSTPSSIPQPTPTPISQTTPELSLLEKAQTQFFTSYEEGDWGIEVDPEHLIEKLQDAAKPFPKEKIVLFFQFYTHGFSFFYAGISGKDEYLPVDFDLGHLLMEANKKTILFPLAITHPQTKKRIVVQVERVETINPPSADAKTSAFLINLLKEASNKSPKEIHILEALIPYAHSIKKEMGNEKYAELRKLIPAYPENPEALF